MSDLTINGRPIGEGWIDDPVDLFAASIGVPDEVSDGEAAMHVDEYTLMELGMDDYE